MREPSLDLRPIFVVVGLVLTTLALAMLLPAALDAMLGHADWLVFAAAAAVSLFAGLATLLTSRTGQLRLSLRQSFLLTAVAWAATAGIGALPFAFSELDLSATDALFEAMAGITTTGATVIRDLDAAPPGILLWRAILQWLGGIGTLIMAVAVLPVLKIGGMQMFRLEGAESADKTMPRAARVASAIILLYLALTAVLAVALRLEGMTGFEALAHAMATISTGGHSTSAGSIGAFGNSWITATVFVGMVVGGMPFPLVLQALRGNHRLLRDPQLRWYLAFLTAGGATVSLWLLITRDAGPAHALLDGFFTVASVMTGTGFFVADHGAWGGLPAAILFFLMFVGGCAGSTASGIKLFRLHILLAVAKAQAARLLSPNAVAIPYYSRRAIPDAVAESVMGFLFIYAFTFACLAILLAMLGLDLVTATSSAASALANAGPGLGSVVGPGGSYAVLPDPAKWLLCAGMLLGRLELFIVVVLFAPAFWRT